MNRTFACGILILALTTPAFGQWHRLTLGVETGVPLNDAFKSSPGSNLVKRDGRKAMAGIRAEAPLPWGLSIRGGLLFRPLAFHRTVTGIEAYPGMPRPGVSSVQPFRDWWNLRGHAWELPVTIKKGFAGNHRVRPFVDAGIAFRHTDVTVKEEYSFEPFFSVSPIEKVKDWRSGPILGAGVDVDVLPLRLSPQVRWSLWLNDGSLSRPYYPFGPARQSVDFVLGFTFK